MWSEEELCDIPEPEVEPAFDRDGESVPVGRMRSQATALRQRLAHLNVDSPYPHEQTRSSIIYSPDQGTHGNFSPAAYQRILANPAWAARLGKAHTAKRKARPSGPDELVRPWRELDAATSSDALLMNIFCSPRVLATPRLPALLGVEPGLEPIFGFHPDAPRRRQLKDRTEIDMRLGDLLVEAKLTEHGFQTAPVTRLERYTDFGAVFDPAVLPLRGGHIDSYQLVRGVLAAHHLGCRFAVFLDARRPELIECWIGVLGAIRSYELQSRCRLLTWQEIARTLPRPLQGFLTQKYGIVA